MEAYPAEYVEHNLPLVLLSGLGQLLDNNKTESLLPRQENGSRIRGNSPDCSGERADLLLKQFLNLDGSDRPWNVASLPPPSGSLRYKMKAIGRTYTLPPRKAAPLPQSPSTEGPPVQLARAELHSPLSPLSPGSPIFPDGLFSPLWMSKHQAHIPALLISFFHISTTDSHTTDEQLKMDINAIRTALSRSGYRTRFAAILLSEKSILHAPELEERLSSIRRWTSLDSKTGLFFMPPMNSAAEIVTFVHSVMVMTLQPLVVEYYRDLTKHARRKKTRGGPTPSLSSPTTAAGAASLSTVGWNARYEIKLAVFAEFRQEMDVAERHYSASLDELFSSEGVFETTPSWSSRWDEARMLADSIAMRQVRCLLWSERTTAAVQCWQNFQTKMRDLVDRRGKGSGTYGWAAWESRWAQVMAELLQRASILPAPGAKAGVNEDIDESQLLQVFAPPEKTAATSMERLPPWQHMHHSGYWYRLAVRGSRERRRRGNEIPEEDRKALGAEKKSSLYDTYLASQPNEEFDGSEDLVPSLIGPLTEKATSNFALRGQSRMSEVMKLELARDYVEAGLHSEAMDILVSTWEKSSWRSDDWHDLFTDLLLLLRDSAREQSRGDIVLATTYELMRVPPRELDGSKRTGLNLMESLTSLPSATEPIKLEFRGGERLTPVTLSVVFENKETHVGEAIGCQLVIHSKLPEVSGAVQLSNTTLQIGATKQLHVTHSADAVGFHEDSVDLSKISESSNGILEAATNLSIRPGQSRAYNFALTFREADVFAIRSASISFETDKYKIQHSFREDDLLHSDSIFVKTGDVLEKRLLPHTDTATVRVLPKPPKVRILLHGLRKQYYTDELVRLGVEVVNGEADTVSGEVNARSEGQLPLQWMEDDAGKVEECGLTSDAVARNINDLEPSDAQKNVLVFKALQDPTRATITIDVDYRLSEDDSTSLRKSLILELHIVSPFEVKFSFGPLLYKERWPSYFNRELGSTSEDPGGIPQLWRLSAQIHSLAADNIVLKHIMPVVDGIVGDSTASIVDPTPTSSEPFGPGDIERSYFEILTQKLSLDDRRPTTVEATLEISWARDENSAAVTTQLPVPRLTLPVSEPRVLCTLAKNDSSVEDDHPSEWDAALQYHIENPSTHFLTFALTMEATEEFAFSGPKYRTLSLAPLSRHKVEYRLALQDQSQDGALVSNENNEKGRWIWPSLQVIDSYYQKTLRVHPGSDNVKFDEKQNIAVFIKDK